MSRRIVQPLGPDVDTPEDIDAIRERRRMNQRRYYARHREDVRKRENAQRAAKRRAHGELLDVLKRVAGDMEWERPKNDPLLMLIKEAIAKAEGKRAMTLEKLA